MMVPMTFSAPARAPRPILFATVVVMIPWIALILPNSEHLPWLSAPAGLILPAAGAVLGILAVAAAVVVRGRTSGAVPAVAAGALAATAYAAPAAAALGAVLAGVLAADPAVVLSASGVSTLVTAFLLLPAWVAASRLAAPLVEPLRLARYPRMGASIVLVASVAGISLAIWIASGAATSGAEPLLAWGGLTYAVSWGALGIALMAVGRTREVGAAYAAPGGVALWRFPS
jgi:hypothetical protein